MSLTSNIDALINAWSFDLVQEVAIVASEHETELADLNREQLMEGKDSEGNTLRKYRRPRYARVKNEMNPVPGYGNPDLKLTGAFHRSIFADVEGKSILFDAKDSKVSDLAAKYGESIFGLSVPKEQKAWSEVVRTPLIINIARRTGAELK